MIPSARPAVRRRRWPLATDQRGVILIQVGLALVVLLGFSAFAIDYGVLWVAREQAQNAADAGALAAATTLAFDEAFDTASAEQEALAFATRTPVWGQPPVAVVEICDDPLAETCPTIPFPLPTPEARSAFSATVSVYRDQAHGNALPTYLASLFGVGSQNVKAQATATVAPANVATCVWPLAMPDNWRDRHPVDPSLNLPKPFTKYQYPGAPGATVASPVDVYSKPPLSSEVSSLSYQWTESASPMKATGLDPQVFVELLGPELDNPLLWRPVRRKSLAAVRVGGGGFSGSLTSCNTQPLHIGDLLPLDPAATWAQAIEGANAAIGLDGGASWDGLAFRIRGSCAATGACGSISPRLVLVPMFDPEEYDRTRLVGASGCDGGLPCIKVVNFVGFFIDSGSDPNWIVGHLTTYPGKVIDITKPFVGYKFAFLRTAVLTR